MLEIRFGAALVASCAFALAGCGGSDDSSSGGPAEVSDGTYAYLTSSAGGSAQGAGLEIEGDSITLIQDADTTAATIGDPVAESVLCPPNGRGQPRQIDVPLAVATVALASPAIFGDCGQTTPRRLTLVDLDSYDEAAGSFGYTRWVEFCDTSDPDCISQTE